MTDSWDEVLDWERWAKEVLTDWRVPFDNHKVGLRLGITQQLCDLRDERDALAARLAEAERDAARYRWLREHTVHSGLESFVGRHDAQFLDIAVDAAMTADREDVAP